MATATTTTSKEHTVEHRSPSPAQLDLIKRLQAERGIALATDAEYAALSGGRDGSASALITALIAMPKPGNETGPTRPGLQSRRNAERNDGHGAAACPKVADGRYAVQTEHDDQLRFYKVNSPTEGRWAGFTFVDMYASEERYPVRDRARKAAILAAIAANPQEAMERYGRELGHCGHCGRALTDEESRARGIGPVCLGRMEWA